jgi:indolepyruvate ferredoxin oxidoreductase beta subunit
MTSERHRMTVAILALGGQGGGVLSDWLIAVGEGNGYYVQATSVQGVAQRTGTTVYYLEFVPEEAIPEGLQPMLALMPAPGDVDIVIASELMEAGRAILRGFVTRGRTALITSTHRIYAISEKSATSGGLADSSKVLDAARQNAKSLVAFDMDAATARTGSAISAVMLGAIAGADALSFSRSQYEDAIRSSGIAVDANLSGFAAGFDAAQQGPLVAPEAKLFELLEPTSKDGQFLRERVVSELPAPVQPMALEGVRRLMDYQDADYAALYLDRLAAIKALDIADWILTCETARALAVWMSYEDVMRVAQQKVRRARMDKVRAEVNAQPGQILQVTEYLHPRWQELCDTLPAGLGRHLLHSTALRRLFAPIIEKGRHVRTTGIGWFLMLNVLASRRNKRRGTLRYQQENARIETWLATIAEAASSDRIAALEVAKCQNLIKGYGATHERGLQKFAAIMNAYRKLHGASGSAQILRSLRDAASKDEDGLSLERALEAIDQRHAERAKVAS